jgi:hypothetical protein
MSFHTTQRTIYASEAILRFPSPWLQLEFGASRDVIDVVHEVVPFRSHSAAE